MSKENDRKRQRAPNFSADEKVKLLNIIHKYKHIVENKATNAVTWQDKSKAWTAITNEFNSSTNVHRTTDSLKGFFENQKRQTHKKAAIEKREIKSTGGGSFTPANDPILELTLDIVNKKTVYGLSNPFDGDRDFEDEGTSGSDPLPHVGLNELESPVEVNEAATPVNTLEAPENITLDWGNSKEALLKTPLSSKLGAAIQQSHREVMPRSQEEIGQNKEKTARKQNANTKNNAAHWTHRRRPALSATASVAKKYEDVADIKCEIATIQLSILKRAEAFQIKTIEESERRLTEQRHREEELHRYQIRKEDLDVAIKEAQLEMLSNRK